MMKKRISEIPALAVQGPPPASRSGQPQRSVLFREKASPRRIPLSAPSRRVPTRAEMDRRLGGRHLDLEVVIYGDVVADETREAALTVDERVAHEAAADAKHPYTDEEAAGRTLVARHRRPHP